MAYNTPMPTTAPLTRLITVTADDGLLLPALFYEPEKPTNRLVIWLHGMGSSGIFYNPGHTNALAAAFTTSGTAFLGLQNRGGGMLQGVKFIDADGEKQKRLQAPESTYISVSQVVPATAGQLQKGTRARAAGATFALGVFASLFAAFASESISTRRKQRRESGNRHRRDGAHPDDAKGSELVPAAAP